MMGVAKLRIIVSLFLLFSFSISAIDRSAVEYYQMGQEEFYKSNYYLAIDYFKEALLDNPSYLEAILALSYGYFMLEEYDEANRYIEEARRYGRNNLNLLNLQARILIGQNDLAQAREIFMTVLNQEPNNLDANLGIAEIDLITGNLSSGANRYQRSLRLAPESRRALLSLVLLYDSEENYSVAEEYIRLALSYHANNPEVYYQAALHYLKMGNLDLAVYYGEYATQLSPNMIDAFLLTGYIHLNREDYNSAIESFMNCLQIDQTNGITLYLLGLTYQYMGMNDEALYAFETSLYYNPDDEIARLALENYLIDDLSAPTMIRTEYAQSHWQSALEFERNYYYEKSLREFRRARKIDLTNFELWKDYADILFRLGYRGKYYESLKAMETLGYADEQFQEELNLLNHSVEDLIYKEWGILQYEQESKPYNVTLFSYINSNTLHYNFEPVITDYVQYLLEIDSQLDVTVGNSQITTFSEAFRMARQQESDYFIIMSYSETERTFHCRAEIYLSRTGAPLTTLSILRTGNRNVVGALEKVSQEISDSFPIRGQLIVRDRDRGIVNLGRYHGISEGDQFVIIKKDRANLISEDRFFSYQPQDLIATFTVESVEEEIAIGSIDNIATFDLLSIGDDMFLVGEEWFEEFSEIDQSNIPMDQELINQLLKLY